MDVTIRGIGPDDGRGRERLLAWLARDEPLHMGPIGRWGATSRTGRAVDAATAERSGAIVAATVRLGPGASRRPLELAVDDPAALPPLLDHVLRGDDDAVELTGTRTAVAAAVAHLTAATGRTVRSRMDQHVLVAHDVTAPTGVPGQARPATPGDLEVMAAWCVDALAEIGMPPAPSAGAAARAWLDDPSPSLLWCDPEPVAMAVAGQPTPRGVRVMLVYTPPPHRRRGYAAAVTAATTAEALASGRSWCALYTDAANPTSNGVYERIGYRRHADVAFASLGAAGGASGT